MCKSLAGRSTMPANRSARVVGRTLLLVSLQCCRWEQGTREGGKEDERMRGRNEGGCLGGGQARSRSTSSRAIRKARLLIWLIQRLRFFPSLFFFSADDVSKVMLDRQT